MTDDEKRAVILNMVAREHENPDLWGDARLRKAVLFLEKTEGLPLGFTFHLERERPVSPELQLFLENMKLDGFLKVSGTSRGYRISADLRGLDLLSSHKTTVSKYEEAITRTFETVRDLPLTDLRVAAREAFLDNPD
ncbi:MAG: hypothetical protein U9R40_02620 [Synergistota bacterium]|nr:hypothetical protein [Synergistota bacterium]